MMSLQTQVSIEDIVGLIWYVLNSVLTVSQIVNSSNEAINMNIFFKNTNSKLVWIYTGTRVVDSFIAIMTRTREWSGFVAAYLVAVVSTRCTLVYICSIKKQHKCGHYKEMWNYIDWRCICIANLREYTFPILHF